MINSKYKNIYDKFIKSYEDIHVNPWHQINKDELKLIYDKLISEMNVTDEYSFKYFMDYIIKRLSGLEDVHTYYLRNSIIPFNFRKFNDSVLVNYPSNLRGYNLVSINGISISYIIDEIDEVITYGTSSKRDYEIEKALFNKMVLFSLPSLRDSSEIVLELEDNKGNKLFKSIKKDEKYDNLFDYDKYLYGNNCNYKIVDNCLIYNHSSVQDKFKDLIESSINKLKKENLSGIDTIIIDLRGNFGGNSTLNKLLIDYLKTQTDKKLICLTDYRVFSGGRYALIDLIKLGAITIGEDISTPINCYGNSNWCNIDDHYFSISECYFHPLEGISIESKKEYIEKMTKIIKKPYIYHPDIKVLESKEDYLNNIDTILSYALKYSKNKNLKM